MKITSASHSQTEPGQDSLSSDQSHAVLILSSRAGVMMRDTYPTAARNVVTPGHLKSGSDYKLLSNDNTINFLFRRHCA
ncbi:hypothetical protein RRG08_018658 [Elysia crispata]|uniref:Uncharacterized protein n=1 Tax=Elysia crispata TaxID=231223 RepID=A0AAE0XZE9_9GAST|nr:hypothetical protein RRG08_018658 [Elysia crispata]